MSDWVREKQFWTIREVSQELGVPQHVLRFWESRFESLQPKRTETNRRCYVRDDVELAHTIHDLLYRQGYTVEGARRLLFERNHSRKSPAPVSSRPNVNSHIGPPIGSGVGFRVLAEDNIAPEKVVFSAPPPAVIAEPDKSSESIDGPIAPDPATETSTPDPVTPAPTLAQSLRPVATKLEPAVRDLVDHDKKQPDLPVETATTEGSSQPSADLKGIHEARRRLAQIREALLLAKDRKQP